MSDDFDMFDPELYACMPFGPNDKNSVKAEAILAHLDKEIDELRDTLRLKIGMRRVIQTMKEVALEQEPRDE